MMKMTRLLEKVVLMEGARRRERGSASQRRLVGLQHLLQSRVHHLESSYRIYILAGNTLWARK